MSIAAGSLVGYQHSPVMQLHYGCVIRRFAAGYSPLGSPTQAYVDLDGVTPCDVSPMSDDLLALQSGQTDALTHVIHFQPGTNVKIRDEVRIVYAPQPGNYGNVGDVYLLNDVLLPSEDLAYIRCRATRAKTVIS